MSDIRYGIQYENYSECIELSIGNLMQMQHSVDVTLMCNTHSLRVHKVMLAASSPYFHEVLKNRPGELLIIMKMNFVVLKSLVEYIYSGKTTILESDMDELISAARFLKIKGLSEIKEQCENLPEFSPPVIFNQPYGATGDNSQSIDNKKHQVEPYLSSLYPQNYPANNVVLRIPIEINTHHNESSAVDGSKVRNKYRQHYMDRYGEVFSKSRQNRRRGQYNKYNPKVNMLGTRLLNKATRKVLRKEEKSSLQTIQQIKKLHGQTVQQRDEELELFDSVDSILDPSVMNNCEEFIVADDEHHTAENAEISEQYHDNNQTWTMDNSAPENPNINTALTEYVDVLKSTGLPTDVPILFELEDGSYVNISEEVLLDMVQSKSVQYEVIEPTAITEQLIQNGLTKSINQISEEICDSSMQPTENIIDSFKQSDDFDMQDRNKYELQNNYPLEIRDNLHLQSDSFMLQHDNLMEQTECLNMQENCDLDMQQNSHMDMQSEYVNENSHRSDHFGVSHPYLQNTTLDEQYENSLNIQDGSDMNITHYGNNENINDEIYHDAGIDLNMHTQNEENDVDTILENNYLESQPSKYSHHNSYSPSDEIVDSEQYSKDGHQQVDMEVQDSAIIQKETEI